MWKVYAPRTSAGIQHQARDTKQIETVGKPFNNLQERQLTLRQLIEWHSIPKNRIQVAFMRETQKLVLHRPTELPLEFRYAERPAWISCEECPELVCK